MAHSEKIDHHMSAEDFCRDSDAVHELNQFLESETGRKLRRVLAGLHPLKQAARVKNLTMLDMLAIAQAEQVNPQGVLGFQRGYEAVVSLIEQTLTTPLHIAAPASRKARRTISPHPTTITT